VGNLTMAGAVRTALTIAAGALAWLGPGPQSALQPSRPFEPGAVVEHVEMDPAETFVKMIREPEADLAIIGAIRTTADGTRLAAWFHQVEQLQRGAYIPILRRFSDPPRIEDLAALVLDEDDLDELRECRPRHCDLKLSAAEMDQMRGAIGGAGRAWRRAAQNAFRQIVLQRARVYLARGFKGTPPYDDQKRPVWIAEEFERLLEGCGLAGLRTPAIAGYLRSYPNGHGDHVESFLFWSKDLLGDAKPIVGITAVDIFHVPAAADPVVVASTQVFATHYITASLSLTSIVQEPETAVNYLVYARCTRADVFHGTFGGLLRRIAQKRIRAEGPAVLEGLRRKLESGMPAR